MEIAELDRESAELLPDRQALCCGDWGCGYGYGTGYYGGYGSLGLGLGLNLGVVGVY